MTDNASHRASISLRPTHGTATPIQVRPVIPPDKRDCEVFWVEALLHKLPEMQSLQPTAVSCKDDSHGNHDVIITLNDGRAIGVQVTELTYELERARRSQRERFVADCLKSLEKRGLTTNNRRLIVECLMGFVPPGRYPVPNPEYLVDATAKFIHESPEHRHAKIDSARLLFSWVEEGELFVPSVGGIGIDCNLDALPHTLDTYRVAVSCLRDKKSLSKSPWLLIWSRSFWQDKHWLGDDVLAHMRTLFADSHFERVFFMESMDGDGLFDANLAIHSVKA